MRDGVQTGSSAFMSLALVVVPALQGRTIVVARILATGLLRVVGRSAPQRRTSFLVLRTGHLAAVLDGRESRLHIVEFRGIDDVLVASRQHLGNLVLALGDAVRRLRMGG